MRMRERTRRGVSERQDDISAGPLSSHPSDFYSSSSFSFFFLVCFLIFKLHFTYLLWCREDRTQDLADGRQPLNHCTTPSAPTFVLDRPPNRSLSLHCPVSPPQDVDGREASQGSPWICQPPHVFFGSGTISQASADPVGGGAIDRKCQESWGFPVLCTSVPGTVYDTQ